jgi:hypothetical protein
MTICKGYVIKDEDTIKILYDIQVKLDIGLGNIFLHDTVDYTIKSDDDLSVIQEFEEEAKKREEVLKEKAMKLINVANKLDSMGYTMIEEDIVAKDPIIRSNLYDRY